MFVVPMGNSSDTSIFCDILTNMGQFRPDLNGKILESVCTAGTITQFTTMEVSQVQEYSVHLITCIHTHTPIHIAMCVIRQKEALCGKK